jgi:hypothetical protein
MIDLSSHSIRPAEFLKPDRGKYSPEKLAAKLAESINRDTFSVPVTKYEWRNSAHF